MMARPPIAMERLVLSRSVGWSRRLVRYAYDHGISQADLARELGLNESSVMRALTSRRVRPSTVMRYTEAVAACMLREK